MRLSIPIFILLAVLTGCGGGSTAPPPPPPPPPPPQAPSITTQPAAQAVTVGSSAMFSVVASGTAPLSYQWQKGGANIQGATSANFTIASVAMSDAGSYTVVVTNSAGSATSNAAVLTVNQPAPVISSITPDKIFCLRECIVGNISIRGTGFAAGQTLRIEPFGDIILAPGTSPTEILINLAFDTPSYNPGFINISVIDASAGSSNVAHLAFVGNLNTLAASSTHAFQLDQEAGKVHRFRLSDGMKDLEWQVGGLNYSISFDEVNGRVGLVLPGLLGVTFLNSSGQGVVGNANGKASMALVSRGGFACVSQDLDNQIIVMQLNQTNPPMLPVAVGDKPHAVAMGQVGNDLACVVYNREDRMLSAIRVSDQQLLRFIALVGATPESQLGSAQGGWQLATFNSGSANGKAVALSQTDQKLFVVDYQSQPAIQLQTIALQGNPFRIAANEADGSVVVAYADIVAGLTRFEKINPNTGVVTSLSATSNLLCTGFGISADGTKLYCAMRDQFQILPNN